MFITIDVIYDYESKRLTITGDNPLLSLLCLLNVTITKIKDKKTI